MKYTKYLGHLFQCSECKKINTVCQSKMEKEISKIVKDSEQDIYRILRQIVEQVDDCLAKTTLGTPVCPLCFCENVVEEDHERDCAYSAAKLALAKRKDLTE